MYKWEEIYGNLCSWFGRHTIIMKTTLTKVIIKSMQPISKPQQAFFGRKQQADPECKKCRKPKTILQNKAVGPSLPYFKATVIKIV